MICSMEPKRDSMHCAMRLGSVSRDSPLRWSSLLVLVVSLVGEVRVILR